MPSSSWVTRHNYALFGLEPPAKPKPADQRIQFEKDKNRAITEAETVITRLEQPAAGHGPDVLSDPRSSDSHQARLADLLVRGV